MTRPWILLPSLLSLSVLASCGREKDPSDGSIQVVASFSILADWVQVVGGDDVKVKTLVGAGGDAHVYSPSPRDVITLGESDILFELGVGFEAWMKDLVESSRFKGKKVTVSEGADLKEPNHVGNHDHDHSHETDPHLWHDIDNVKVAIGHIREAFIALDPDSRSGYEKRAAAYLDELTALDTWIKEHLSAIPDSQRYLITSHDSLGYLARKYDFTVIGSALGSISTESEDPSPANLAELVESIKSLGVRAVFFENMHSSKVVDTLATECGIKSHPMLTDALAPSGSIGSTYLDFMRANAETLVKALTR